MYIYIKKLLKNDIYIIMSKFIITYDNNKILNFIVKEGIDSDKTSLSISLNNHPDTTNIFINHEENINYISYETLLPLLNTTKKVNYYIERGIFDCIDISKLIVQLLENNKDDSDCDVLKSIFYNYIFGINFIMKLLSIYHEQIPLSNQQFKSIIEDEKNKIKINEKMYDIAIKTRNYNALNILCSHDARDKDVIIHDFYTIFNILSIRDTQINSKEFIKKIENEEINIPMDQPFLDHLNQFHFRQEQLKLYDEFNSHIVELIQNNNIAELNNYIEEKNILLPLFNEQYHESNDILSMALKHNCSIKTLEFIIKEFKYENLDFNFFDENGDTVTPLYYSLLNNHFKIFDFLLEKGANLNNKNFNILTHLYESQQLNTKKLIYILNNDYTLELDILIQFIRDNQLCLLKCIFKMYNYSNPIIQKLLSFYQNKKALSDQALKNILTAEQDKIVVNEVMYSQAIEKRNYEMLELLYRHDRRKDDVIFITLFKLFDKIEFNFPGIKQEFTDKVKGGELNLPIPEYFLYQLCHVEEIRQEILNRIDANQFEDLKYYITSHHILLNNLNNDYFDLLIYAIRTNVSSDILNYILPSYPTLNYTIHKYESPLYCAIFNHKFAIARQLLEEGAQLAYLFNNLNVFYRRYRGKFYDKSNHGFFKSVFSHGLIHSHQITPSLINSLIRYKENEILNMIFQYVIFDNTFILNLLSMYYRQVKLSDTQLQNMIMQERRKITITSECYEEALRHHNQEALTILSFQVKDQQQQQQQQSE